MVGLPTYDLSKEERHSYIHGIVAAREKSINAYLDRRLPPGQAHGRNHIKLEAKELFPLVEQDHEWPHWFFDPGRWPQTGIRSSSTSDVGNEEIS